MLKSGLFPSFLSLFDDELGWHFHQRFSNKEEILYRLWLVSHIPKGQLLLSLCLFFLKKSTRCHFLWTSPQLVRGLGCCDDNRMGRRVLRVVKVVLNCYKRFRKIATR